MYKIFNPSDIVKTGFSLEEAQRVLSEFADICDSGRWYGDLALYQLWKDRLEYILHEFSGFGWGMDDYISGEYYSLPWIEEKQE